MLRLRRSKSSRAATTETISFYGVFMSRFVRLLPAVALLCCGVFALAQAPDYARDPHQAIDDAYTAAIRKYTTAPEFNSPLTDYLPASKTVPTPARVLGDVSGAPD
ncbi:MAG: putative lipoprotein, partial [Bryobacterales bacterium]|nr:putative lipoprotein [Bryobacterales bacterium]